MSKYAREEKLEMIRQYREEHRSIEWISKEYGISQSYLREILKKSQNGETAEIEKDLIAEVQRLRMENEYLKKLQALVKEGKRSPRK